MFPIYKSKYSIFNYNDIPPGYYFNAMLNGSAVQRYWHNLKFKSIIDYIQEGDCLLDFGCGPGSFLYMLGKSDKKFQNAIGVDVSSAQIEFAIENVEQNNPNIHFVKLESDQIAFPFDDEQFDLITTIEVAEHIHPYILSQIINELKRCLKKNGRMVFTTPNYRSLWPFIEVALNRLSPVEYHEQHINKYTPNSFMKFLETMGLEVVSLKSIFVGAPFLALVSDKLADACLHIEEKLLPTVGSLLIAETKVKHFD